jgi:hypothetical protein
MRTIFQRVGFKRSKKFVCSCGRKLTRIKTFYQTINPWNQKTPEQILNEEAISAHEWKAIPDPCDHLDGKGEKDE